MFPNVNVNSCLRSWKTFNLIYVRVRHKSFNSAEWLKRRENDIFIAKYKHANYRCRSAFKLIEIDDKYNLAKPGFKVVDVGAAPGSWSQVLAERTNSNGKDDKKPKGMVIAIDLSGFSKIDGVTILQNRDFTKESTQREIKEILGENQLDLVVSDMAPPATGVKTLDQENILKLVYPVLLFSVNHLTVGGGCLIKMFEGQHSKFANEMKRFFKMFNFVKPSASYSSSSELYLLGRDFVGLKT